MFIHYMHITLGNEKSGLSGQCEHTRVRVRLAQDLFILGKVVLAGSKLIFITKIQIGEYFRDLLMLRGYVTRKTGLWAFSGAGDT